MIYFFAKGQQFTQCEIHPGPPHVLRVITPNGAEEMRVPKILITPFPEILITCR